MKKLSTISLRFWLPVFVIGAFALLLTASSLWRNWQETQEEEQQAMVQLRVLVKAEQYRVEQLLRLNTHALITDEIAQVGSLPEVEFIALANAQARILYASQPVLIGQPLSSAHTGFDEVQIRRAKQEQHLEIQFDATHSALLVYAPITFPFQAMQEATGVLLLKYSLGSVTSEVRERVLNDLCINLGITLVMALSLIFCLHRWFTQPLHLLQETVSRMSEGDFKVGVNLTGSGELAKLGNNIEQMQQARINAEADLIASEALLRNVVDGFGPSSFVGLLTLDGHILLANQPALTAAGIRLEDVLNKPVADTYWFAYSPSAQQQMRDAVTLAAGGTASRFDILIRGPGDNAFFWIDFTIQPVYDNTGKVCYLVPSALVIQERKLAETALQASELALMEAQRLAQIGNWRWDIAANRVYWSAEVFRIYGRDPELTLQTYEEQLKFYTPESAARLHAAVANAMSDGTAYALDLERDNSRQDNLPQDNSQQDNSPRDTAGSEPTQWVTARGEAFRDASGQIVQLRGTVQDITARKLAEAALSESEQRFRDTFKLMPAAVTLQTEAGVLIDASDIFCQVTGYSREEAIDQNVLDLNLWVQPEQRVVMREVLQRDGQVDGVEVLLRRRGGDTYTTMQVSARYLTIGGERLLLAFAHDITERKQADAELLVALNEKTALLKEVHHRVKNNLQVITSLLSLEAARCNDLATKTVLKDMKGRIRSMALLHETLYRTGIFAGVDLSRYLKQLATEVFRTMATTTTATAVSLECALTPLHLEMDQALPCGLLINELLTNSLKHAFPQGGKGIVNVELKLIDDIVHLSVSDTGVGLAPNFNLQQMASLGLHLVADLATQLGGTLQIETGQGATFVVTFALKNPLAAPLHHVNV